MGPPRVLLALAASFLVGALAACGTQELEVGPDEEEPPEAAELDAGQVPLIVQRGPDDSVLAFVEVHFGEAGPYRFALDTGASRTLVAEHVVEEAGLERTGRTAPVMGVVAADEAEVVRLAEWRIEDLELPQTEVVTLDLEHPQNGLDGLLGSDILSLYERIVVDYERGVLELAGDAGG